MDLVNKIFSNKREHELPLAMYSDQGRRSRQSPRSPGPKYGLSLVENLSAHSRGGFGDATDTEGKKGAPNLGAPISKIMRERHKTDMGNCFGGDSKKKQKQGPRRREVSLREEEKPIWRHLAEKASSINHEDGAAFCRWRAGHPARNVRTATNIELLACSNKHKTMTTPHNTQNDEPREQTNQSP
uniref:Uncharacterized protein n=1 Tax=Panagrellus redivivus TaxID=6233 RepID=A0A7E4VTE5_PANRE